MGTSLTETEALYGVFITVDELDVYQFWMVLNDIAQYSIHSNK